MKVVLIIADDQGLRASLRAALPETDLVLFETSVDTALRRLISLQPDVLIVDDAVAVSDSAVGRLRENTPGIPLIVLSTRNDEETRAHFLLAGARECIPKPFSCDALRAAMDKCAARGEYPDPRTLQMPGPAVLEVSHAAAIGQHSCWSVAYSATLPWSSSSLAA